MSEEEIEAVISATASFTGYHISQDSTSRLIQVIDRFGEDWHAEMLRQWLNGRTVRGIQINSDSENFLDELADRLF